MGPKVGLDVVTEKIILSYRESNLAQPESQSTTVRAIGFRRRLTCLRSCLKHGCRQTDRRNKARYCRAVGS